MRVYIKDIETGGLIGSREASHCDEVIETKRYLKLVSYCDNATVSVILPFKDDWMYVIVDEKETE